MKTIIWAVDPLLALPGTSRYPLTEAPTRRAPWKRSAPLELRPAENFQHLAAWALHRFVTRLAEPVRILPITAWESEPFLSSNLSSSPFQIGAPLGPSEGIPLSPEAWVALREDLRNLFAETRERIRIPGLEPLEVIENPAFPLRLRTQLFYERCVELKADLLFIASRGASRGTPGGVAAPFAHRWLGGSFAEHIAGSSAIPCLIMNPSWNRLTDYQNFHFATGFSGSSLTAFEALLPWLRALRAKVRILHFEAPKKTPILGSLPPHSTHSLEGDSRSEHFEQLARAHQVPLELELREEPLPQLVPALIRESEESGGFIGLDAPAPSLRRALRGNPVKRLIRAAHAPLLCVSGEQILAHSSLAREKVEARTGPTPEPSPSAA